MKIRMTTGDFETRSECSLKACGAWKYSEDPSTRPFCFAIRLADGTHKIWIDDYFAKIVSDWMKAQDRDFLKEFPVISNEDIILLLSDPEQIIEAHNSEFERSIWTNVMVKRYGWPDIPIERWRCSAAKTAVHALPRSLADAGKALNLDVSKDLEGHVIMLRLCKPVKPTKAEPDRKWDEDPEKLAKLFSYCMNDVDSEHALSESLHDLSDYEQKVWFMDQKINQRGIRVDLDAVEAVIEMIKSEEIKLLAQVHEVTEGALKSPKQTVKTVAWLKDQGVKMLNLQAQTVIDTLKKDLPVKARKLLELRQGLSKASTAKYKKFLDMFCKDGRVRGTMMYHGAGPGRWTGKGVQVTNLPRGTYKDAQECVDLILGFDYEGVDTFFDTPTVAASKLIRAMLIAKEGHDLISADYSSIEARVIAWLAGSEKILNAFRSGLDVYKVAAAGIYDVRYEDVTYDQRQVGKVAVLALGYQGGWRAFASMAKNYGLKPPEGIVLVEKPKDLKNKKLVRAWKKDWRDNGKKLTEEDAKFKKWASPIVKDWRVSNPEIRQLWFDYEKAALEAVRTGKPKKVGEVYFGVKDKFLWIRLPSGRKLAYYDPQIRSTLMPWKKTETIDGEEVESDVYKDAVTFMNYDSSKGKFLRKAMYGGLIAENATQGSARDVLVPAMFRLEDAGYPIVMHVYDEIVCEIPKDFGSLAEFEEIMAAPVVWAPDCPIEAKGWRGLRYRK